MQPLFTIHAGEFLVADHIERTFRHTHVWIPTKDTGVDLLVTDLRAKHSVSLQVKYSRDYLVTHLPSVYQSELRACGWWTYDPGKLERSPADYWVLLLVGFDNRSRDFVVLRPAELANRLSAIRSMEARLQSYLWITKDKKCWETRGLSKQAQAEVVAGTFRDKQRDFTDCLNNWAPIAELNSES